MTEPPAARRRVFFFVLDHKVSVRWAPGNERLATAKDLGVSVRRGVTPVQGGNDSAVRVRELPFAVGLDRYIVAQNGTQTVEVAFFVGHGYQLPVAVSVGDFVHENRGGLFIRLFRRGGDVGDPAGQRCNGNQQDSDPS